MIGSRTGLFETERHRQRLLEERAAYGARSRTLRSWRFRCADGEDFEAFATTESGALRVLNAERPGMQAELVTLAEVRFR